MPSIYPAGFDVFDDPGAQLVTAPGHDQLHQQLIDALAAVEAVLGLNPQSAAASVAARLAALTTTANLGVATADAAAAAAAAANAALPGKAPADVAWTEVTGVVTSNGSAANITSTLRYRVLATRSVEWECEVFFNGAPTAGGQLVIQCPVGPIEFGTNCGMVVGMARMLDAAAGHRDASVYAIPGGAGGFLINVSQSGYSAPATASAPWAWAVGDEINMSGMFRSA